MSKTEQKMRNFYPTGAERDSYLMVFAPASPSLLSIPAAGWNSCVRSSANSDALFEPWRQLRSEMLFLRQNIEIGRVSAAEILASGSALEEQFELRTAALGVSGFSVNLHDEALRLTERLSDHPENPSELRLSRNNSLTYLLAENGIEEAPQNLVALIADCYDKQIAIARVVKALKKVQAEAEVGDVERLSEIMLRLSKVVWREQWAGNSEVIKPSRRHMLGAKLSLDVIHDALKTTSPLKPIVVRLLQGARDRIK